MTLLSGLLSDTSIHGIPRLINSKSFKGQIYWLLFIVVSITGSIWYIILNVQNYLEYPFITNVNYVKQIRLQFPTISICSYLEYENFPFVLNCSFDGQYCGQYLVHSESLNCYVFNSGRSNNGRIKHKILNATRSSRLLVELQSSLLDNYYKISVYNSSYDDTDNKFIRISNGLTNLY